MHGALLSPVKRVGGLLMPTTSAHYIHLDGKGDVHVIASPVDPLVVDHPIYISALILYSQFLALLGASLALSSP